MHNILRRLSIIDLSIKRTGQGISVGSKCFSQKSVFVENKRRLLKKFNRNVGTENLCLFDVWVG